MRILTITNLFPSSAMPTNGVFILQRVRAIAALGHEVRVISPQPWVPPGPVPARYRTIRAVPASETVDGLPALYPRYPMLPRVGVAFQDRAYAHAVRAAWKRLPPSWRPDIVDVHYLYPDACGVARALGTRGVPWVASGRGADVKVLGAMPGIASRIRRALSGAAAFITVSRDLAESARKLGLYDGPVAVIPNGIDPTRFVRRSKAEARSLLGLPQDGRWIVCVGHLVPEHGHELILRAMAEPTTPRDLRAMFVGGGRERNRLEALVRELSLVGRVHFAGPVPHDRVPHWFSAADASVLITDHEGCPNVVLESFACGRPCLVSDLPEMREVMRDERDGILVPREARAIAAAFEPLLALAADGDSVPPVPRDWAEVARECVDLFEDVRARAKAGARAG